LADKDDLDGISDIINIGRKTTKIGDANGYEHQANKRMEIKTNLI
jgi:putative chitinase